MSSAPTTGRLAALGMGLLCASTGACSGGESTGAQRTIAAASQPARPDTDRDDDGAQPNEDDQRTPPVSDGDNSADVRPEPAGRRRDRDDDKIVDFGRPASARERAVIAALVRRYYTLAVAQEGAKACSLLYSTYAESIAEDFGSPSGPSWSQGETCAVVLTKTFRHFHDELAFRGARLQVAQVRVQGRHGVALLRFPGLLERELDVEREGRVWRMFGLIDKLLP